jgi:SpoVK/Ycf46/Vps4 family AAA+-type ATPase
MLNNAVKNGFFQKETYLKYCELMLEKAGTKNPFTFNMEERNDGELTKSESIESSLSLPMVLKVSNHPLFDDYGTSMHRFATIIAKADGVVTKQEESALKKIYQITHNPVPEEENKAISVSEVDKVESLDEVLKELNGLIGLNEVKKEVKTLINFVQIQKEREKQGLKSSQVSYHCVFTGSPGTGKTTIARLVAKIYKHLGILEKGHLVETDRSGLVAEYLGQTSNKVDKVVKTAIDGILFIDEAYSLVGEGQDDYGKEAVAAIIKRMEDNRDKLVLIVAGYTDEMKDFIDTNPGFKSRFNRYIQFPDYTPDELMKIFELLCSNSEYVIAPKTKESLKEMFNHLYEIKDKDFGNGRLVRNIFEKSIENQSNRIAIADKLTKELLITIEPDDIPKVNTYAT